MWLMDMVLNFFFSKIDRENLSENLAVLEIKMGNLVLRTELLWISERVLNLP